jgi:hypothetical protein
MSHRDKCAAQEGSGVTVAAYGRGVHWINEIVLEIPDIRLGIIDP